MDYGKKRWVTLVVSCIINIIIGTGYAGPYLPARGPKLLKLKVPRWHFQYVMR